MPDNQWSLKFHRIAEKMTGHRVRMPVSYETVTGLFHVAGEEERPYEEDSSSPVGGLA